MIGWEGRGGTAGLPQPPRSQALLWPDVGDKKALCEPVLGGAEVEGGNGFPEALGGVTKSNTTQRTKQRVA